MAMTRRAKSAPTKKRWNRWRVLAIFRELLIEANASVSQVVRGPCAVLAVRALEAGHVRCERSGTW